MTVNDKFNYSRHHPHTYMTFSPSRSHLTAYLDQVLGQMAELLVVATPQDPPALLCPADQLFLLESAATLVVHSALQPQVWGPQYLNLLLSPVFPNFRKLSEF